MSLPEKVSAVLGAIYTLLTVLALFLPKGSKFGALCATLAADFKGHTEVTEVPDTKAK